MGQTGKLDSKRIYSRGELELELGKLALTLARLQSGRRTGIDGVTVWPQSVIEGFLEACVRVLGHARPAHHAMAIDRLCAMATAANLGIIGLEEWLAEHARPVATTTSDRSPAMPVHRPPPTSASTHSVG